MTVNSIIQYIEENLESKFINIDCLVLYSGFSRRYLQISFKEYVGMPIGTYIRVRRASRAAALLRLTRLTIIEISAKLFYDSQQTFTREFKKIFGYTPRQYRMIPFWSFKGLLGRREINCEYLQPRICYLKERNIIGQCFNFRDLVFYSGIDSKCRLGKLYDSLKKNTAITVSNRIPFHDKTNDIIARTVVWDRNKHFSDSEIKVDKGLYAYFFFNDTYDQYVHHMYNIYYNSLPIYNLNKRDGYDVEVIKRRNDNTIDCHYFLPIYCDDMEFYNEMQVYHNNIVKPEMSVTLGLPKS
ncbi:bacterial regulatory helix-turn-helix s, AraC family protein [Yersinia pestis PY-89]|nr:bacterial regulatory helix-turn-helix s, AraC family protein [Yersinia pestis PY-89]